MKANRMVSTVLFVALCGAAVVIAQTDAGPASPPATDGDNWPWKTFWIGVTGAACMYLYWFRTERIQKAIASFHAPKEAVPTEHGWKSVVPEGRLLFFDFFISILLGGVAAAFVAEKGTWKEAFLLGCTWNSIFARLAKTGTKSKT